MRALFQHISKRLGIAVVAGVFALVATAILLEKIRTANATAPDANYTAQYWNDPEWMECEAPSMSTSTPDLVREEREIDHRWSGESPGAGVNSECFTARWTKNVDLSAGAYIFKVGADDGVRLYVDDQLILDKWIIQGYTQYTSKLDLSEGIHTIRLDYYQGHGGSDLTFSFGLPLAHASTWGTDGRVSSLATGPDGTVYAGGAFNYIGPNTGSWVPLSATTSRPLEGFPQVTEGNVYTAVSDGLGGWYIGGTFYYVNGVERPHLAHILSDNSLDLDWNPAPDGTVYSLAVHGTTVYVGGTFDNIGGESRTDVAALDASGTATSWNPGANSLVRTIALSEDGATIYLGGYFSVVGGAAREHIAAVDSDGVVTAWDPNVNDAVIALGFTTSTIYIGGDFRSVGGTDRHYVAALDATTGVATEWDPDADSSVFSLAIHESTIYVGGGFSTIGGASRTNLAEIDRTTGAATSWSPVLNNNVYSIQIFGGDVYVGGYFTTVGGDVRNHIAVIDADTASSTSWAPNTPGVVYAVMPTASTVFVGGEFKSIGGVTRHHAAAIHPTSGEATEWNPNVDGEVYAVAVASSTVYLGGGFSNVGGSARPSIAAVDVTTGALSDWNPGADGTVRALVATGSVIYIGGDFSNAGGAIRHYVAALDSETGFATSWDPDADDTVYALALDGSTLYAGGNFRHVGGVERGRVVALHTSDASSTSWNAIVDNTVEAITVASSTVYIGGYFTSVRGTSRSNIAEISKATGIPTSWNPGANNDVLSIQLTTSTVFAGGYFGYIGGQSRQYVAELARDINTNQATEWNPSPSGDVLAMVMRGDQLYIGGEFNYVQLLHLYLAGFTIKEIDFVENIGSGMGSVTSVSVPIQISAPQEYDVTVHYSATGGTATGGGVHYTLADGVATILAGQTTTTITLAVTPGAVLAGDKTVIISLSSASNGFTVGAHGTFTYTIKDDAFVVYESNDTSVTPGAPGTLVSNLDAITEDESYLTTALSTTTGGYDSQVYRFKPDLTGIATSTFRTNWIGYGDGDPEKQVHISIWNFETEEWEETYAEVCNSFCDISVDITGNDYRDGSGNVWIWLKADKQFGPAEISGVSDNNKLTPNLMDHRHQCK